MQVKKFAMYRLLSKTKRNFVSWVVCIKYLCCNFHHFLKPSLKDAYSDKFLIGNTVNEIDLSEVNNIPRFIVKKHFNCITIGNCMKAHVIHPQSDIFNFQEADRYVNFGEKNNLTITGHALISSLFFPRWIFADENGNEVSKELLIERMRNFITTVIGRYKGRIQSWEVVHEIFDNSGKFINSKFFRILGDDYVKYAFNFAREADPNCILSYSDYGLSMEAKRNAVIKMVKKLQTQGAKIDTIGIQGHCHLGFPVMEELEKSIIAFHELGCKISITEMDISVLPVYNPKISIEIALNPDYWLSLNPFTKEIPKKIAHIQYEQYKAMFNIFLKHHDKIDRVTFWGMSDKYSSKNDFPIPGRTDYPLLFDRNYKAKPVVKELIEMANKNNNQIRFGK